MLSDKIAASIRAGRQRSVFVSLPAGGNTADFEDNLHELWLAMILACTRISAENKGSAERCEFILPTDMDPLEANAVIMALFNSPIEVASERQAVFA